MAFWSNWHILSPTPQQVLTRIWSLQSPSDRDNDVYSRQTTGGQSVAICEAVIRGFRACVVGGCSYSIWYSRCINNNVFRKWWRYKRIFGYMGLLNCRRPHRRMSDVLLEQRWLGGSTRCSLPRCMQCRRGLAMRILSVRPSVCLSNACFVTKR